MTDSDEDDLQELVEQLEGKIEELDGIVVGDPALTHDTLNADGVLDAVEETIETLRDREQ